MPNWFGKGKALEAAEPKSAGEPGVYFTRYAQTVAQQGPLAPYLV